jgi:hypothetical protein
MKLLPTGRSFRQLLDEPTRYKLAQPNLVPKFGQAKAAEPVSSPAENSHRGLVSDAPGEALEKSRSSHRFGFLQWLRCLVKPSGRSAEGSSTQSRKQSADGRAVRAPVKSVQGELLLDRVRPVRSDLLASDIEVVTATKSSPALSPSAAARILRAADHSGIGWRGTHWFGSGKAGRRT